MLAILMLIPRTLGVSSVHLLLRKGIGPIDGHPIAGHSLASHEPLKTSSPRAHGPSYTCRPSLGKQVLKGFSVFLLESHRLRLIQFVQPDHGVGFVFCFDPHDAVHINIGSAILNELYNHPSLPVRALRLGTNTISGD